MEFQFDRQGLWHVAKMAALLGVIIFMGNIVADNLHTFITEQIMRKDSSVSVSAAVDTPQPKPHYQELSRDTLIYSSSSEVLEKQKELVAQKSDFIFTDLTNMELQVYKQGEVTLSSRVLARGKKNSLFETPSGYYKIQSKEENHFSTIGHVWMPWSMHFFGNYFIHGWPYYPDGTPVSEQFSGGCIRLADKDAIEIYKAAKTGMPILVYSGTTTAPIELTYFKKIEYNSKPIAPLALSADAFLVADFDTGLVLLENNARASYPIGSITKLMSALAGVETISRFKVLTITKDVLDESEDPAGLIEDETFKTEDLLYPLILRSSNAIAKLFEQESYGLVKIMNQKARALGLHHTLFKDASGISSENVSSAEDIFKLIQFLATSKKPIFDISGLKEYTLESINKKKTHVWRNVNWLPEDDTFIGGKAGKTTAAGETMAGVFRVTFPEFEKRSVAIMVLQSKDRVSDVKKIIQYLGQNFVYGASSLVKGDSPNGQNPPIHEGASVYEAITNWVN